MPDVRGRLMPGRSLADLTWLRVGGAAEWLFQPADPDDLSQFLAALDPDVPVFPMGVGSNLIVRDGGIDGVVVRLGRGFNAIEIDNGKVRADAAALDARVATAAADAGLDLTFLRTIPGSIGGAVRMNAGCYGAYVADCLEAIEAVNRAGGRIRIAAEDIDFQYRSTDLPPDLIVTNAIFAPSSEEPDALHRKMQAQIEKRDVSQPTKDRTAGSTFRNPAGFSSTGRADDTHELKAWKLIDDAGLRGFRQGDALMSEKHPNFLTNAGSASARELEELGEEVRKRVFQNSGILLEWEIMRVGKPAGA